MTGEPWVLVAGVTLACGIVGFVMHAANAYARHRSVLEEARSGDFLDQELP
jgi:hypothetical protein